MLKTTSHQQLPSLGANRNNGAHTPPGRSLVTPMSTAMQETVRIYTQPQPGADQWAHRRVQVTPKSVFQQAPASANTREIQIRPRSPTTPSGSQRSQQRTARVPQANPVAARTAFPKIQSAAQLNQLQNQNQRQSHPRGPLAHQRPDTTPSQTGIPTGTAPEEGTQPLSSPKKPLNSSFEEALAQESDHEFGAPYAGDAPASFGSSDKGSDEFPFLSPLQSCEDLGEILSQRQSAGGVAEAGSASHHHAAARVNESAHSSRTPVDPSEEPAGPASQCAQEEALSERLSRNDASVARPEPVANAAMDEPPQAIAPKADANALRLKPPALAVKFAEASGIPRERLDVHFQQDHLVFPEGGPVHCARQSLAQAFKNQADHQKKNVGTTWTDVQTSVWNSAGKKAFYTRYAEFFGLTADENNPQDPLGHAVSADGLKSAAVPGILRHLDDRYQPTKPNADGTPKSPIAVLDDYARLVHMLSEMDMFVADPNKFLGRVFSGRTQTEEVRDKIEALVNAYQKHMTTATNEANKKALEENQKSFSTLFAQTGLTVDKSSMASVCVPARKPPAGVVGPDSLPTKLAVNLGVYSTATAMSAVNLSNPAIPDEGWMDLVPMVATLSTSLVVFDSIFDLARQILKAKDATAEAKQQAATLDQIDQELKKHEADLTRWLKEDPVKTLRGLDSQWSALVEKNSASEGWPGRQQDEARAEFDKRKDAANRDLEKLHKVLGKGATWGEPPSAPMLSDLLAPKIDATKKFRAQIEGSLAMSALDATTRMAESLGKTESGIKRLQQLEFTVLRSVLLQAGRIADFLGQKAPFGLNTFISAAVAFIESKIRLSGRIGESGFMLATDRLDLTRERVFARQPGTGKVLEHSLSALGTNKAVLNEGYSIMGLTKVVQGFASMGAFMALPVLGPLAPMITALLSSFAGTLAATYVLYAGRENKNTAHMQNLVGIFDQSIEGFANEETLRDTGPASREKMADLDIFLEEYIENARATQESEQGAHDDGPHLTENARRKWNYIEAMSSVFHQLGAPRELSADFFQTALRCKPLPKSPPADDRSPQAEALREQRRIAAKSDPLREQLRKSAKMILLEASLFTGPHSGRLETEAGLGKTPLRDKRPLRMNALMEAQFRRPRYA